MQIAVTIFLDGMVTASYLFIVAVGLTMVFGVMKILNVAHGALYASGAYGAAYLIQNAAGLGYPDWIGFILIPIAAIVAGFLIGLVLERGILKRLYGQDEVTVLLATFALFLILEDALHLVFGTQTYQAYQPMLYLGDREIAGVHRDLFSGLLIVAAAIIAASGWAVLRFTRHGRLVKAVVFDREVSEAMGIKVNKVFTRTFVIGCILGAFGGACVAPLISVTPGIGVEIIAISFAVVAIGGMGSIPGAVLGALAVGFTKAAAVHLFPQGELFVVYAVMVIVLSVRPEGIFSLVAARRI
jgi:branched-chain amino acid transport system permease protein